MSFEIIFFAHLSQRRLFSISSVYLCFIISISLTNIEKKKTDISQNISFKMLSIYCFLLFMPIITSNVSFLDSLVKTTDRNRSDRTKTNNQLPDQAVHRSVVETILENRLLLDNSIQVQFSPSGVDIRDCPLFRTVCFH